MNWPFSARILMISGKASFKAATQPGPSWRVRRTAWQAPRPVPGRRNHGRAGGRARRVPVRIAFLQGDRAVLSGGLEGVDEIVLEGASKLVDGAPVRLAP